MKYVKHNLSVIYCLIFLGDVVGSFAKNLYSNQSIPYSYNVENLNTIGDGRTISISRCSFGGVMSNCDILVRNGIAQAEFMRHFSTSYKDTFYLSYEARNKTPQVGWIQCNVIDSRTYLDITVLNTNSTYKTPNRNGNRDVCDSAGKKGKPGLGLVITASNWNERSTMISMLTHLMGKTTEYNQCVLCLLDSEQSEDYIPSQVYPYPKWIMNKHGIWGYDYNGEARR